MSKVAKQKKIPPWVLYSLATKEGNNWYNPHAGGQGLTDRYHLEIKPIANLAGIDTGFPYPTGIRASAAAFLDGLILPPVGVKWWNLTEVEREGLYEQGQSDGVIPFGYANKLYDPETNLQYGASALKQILAVILTTLNGLTRPPLLALAIIRRVTHTRHTSRPSSRG